MSSISGPDLINSPRRIGGGLGPISTNPRIRANIRESATFFPELFRFDELNNHPAAEFPEMSLVYEDEEKSVDSNELRNLMYESEWSQADELLNQDPPENEQLSSI